MLLAGALVVALAVVLAAVLVGGGSGKNAGKTTTAGSTDTTATGTTIPTTPNGPSAIEAMFAGIPQHGDTVGRADAPATMLVFEDPQCPYCAEWNVNTLPTVLEQYVRTGKLKISFRGIQIVGPNSGPGLRAIVAAGSQNKLWNLNEAMYANQGQENSGWITNDLISQLASDLKIDAAKLTADANSAATTKTLNAWRAEAAQYRVGGTPTFEILRPPGTPQQLHESSLEPEGFTAALSAALG